MSATRMLKLGLLVGALFIVPASVHAQTCKTPQVEAKMKDLEKRINLYRLMYGNASSDLYAAQNASAGEAKISALEKRKADVFAKLIQLDDEWKTLNRLPPCTVTNRPVTKRPPGVPFHDSRDSALRNSGG